MSSSSPIAATEDQRAKAIDQVLCAGQICETGIAGIVFALKEARPFEVFLECKVPLRSVVIEQLVARLGLTAAEVEAVTATLPSSRVRH